MTTGVTTYVLPLLCCLQRSWNTSALIWTEKGSMRFIRSYSNALMTHKTESGLRLQKPLKFSSNTFQIHGQAACTVILSSRSSFTLTIRTLRFKQRSWRCLRRRAACRQTTSSTLPVTVKTNFPILCSSKTLLTQPSKTQTTHIGEQLNLNCLAIKISNLALKKI